MSIAEGLDGIFEDPSLVNRANTFSQNQTFINLYPMSFFPSAGGGCYLSFGPEFLAWLLNGTPTIQFGGGDYPIQNLINNVGILRTPVASNPTIVSGTTYQNNTYSYQTLYIPVYASTAGTAGTAAVALGTSSTPATIFTQYVSGGTSSTSQEVITLHAPPQWYYSITLSGATLGTVTQTQE